MEIVRDLNAIKKPYPRAVVTIGNFDGVHLGHREIFRGLVKKAEELKGTSVVCTFEPHPLKLLRPEEAPALISTYDEKERLIGASSVDVLVSIPFTLGLAAFSPQRFVDEILVKKIGMVHLVVGYDYAFGKNRSGDINFLKRMAKQYDFSLEVLTPQTDEEEVYSSTLVRQLLVEGDVKKVVSVLGRQFNLEGKVVRGEGRGKTLGYPTANLSTDKEILPLTGVYAVKVRRGRDIFDGVANVGFNPTFHGKRLTLEVHLLDMNEELYGESLRVYFVDRLREEKRFEDKETLVRQISKDILKAKKLLKESRVIEFKEYLSRDEG